MCYCPLAGEPTKICHPTTTSADLSYLCPVPELCYSGLIVARRCIERKKKERNSLKLEKPYFCKGRVSFGQGYVKHKFETRLTYKCLDNLMGFSLLLMYSYDLCSIQAWC